MKLTTEVSLRVFNDEDGSHIYIGPDADGLDCVEIRWVEPDGRISERATMPVEMAREVQAALSRYLELIAQ